MGAISFAILTYVIDHVFPYDGTKSDETKEFINAAIDPVGTLAPEIAEFAVDSATYIAVPDKRHEIARKPIRKRQEKLKTKLKRLKESGHIDEYNKTLADFKKQLFYMAEHKQGIPFEMIVLLKGDFDIDINMQDEKQRTLLFYATAQRNAYLVRYLLTLGADPEIKDYVNLRPIDLIDKQNDHEIYLAFHHIDVEQKAKSAGLTNVQATYTYDQQNNIVATKVIGEQQSSWTPLMMAINNRESSTAQQYIDRGDDIEAATNNGSTALFFAIKHHDDMIVDLLLAHGANIEHRNKFQMNPLALAIRLDNLYAVKALIKAGVNTHGICASSRTPVKYAEVNRRDEIVRYLKSVGAS